LFVHSGSSFTPEKPGKRLGKIVRMKSTMIKENGERNQRENDEPKTMNDGRGTGFFTTKTRRARRNTKKREREGKKGGSESRRDD